MAYSFTREKNILLKMFNGGLSRQESVRFLDKRDDANSGHWNNPGG
jgi:hypothetical protein